MIKKMFTLLECSAFIAPATPESMFVRFTILSIYFIGHYFKLQINYVKFKNDCITKYSLH